MKHMTTAYTYSVSFSVLNLFCMCSEHCLSTHMLLFHSASFYSRLIQLINPIITCHTDTALMYFNSIVSTLHWHIFASFLLYTLIMSIDYTVIILINDALTLLHMLDFAQCFLTQCLNVQREKTTRHVVQLKKAPALIQCPSCSPVPAPRRAPAQMAMSAMRERASSSWTAQV